MGEREDKLKCLKEKRQRTALLGLYIQQVNGLLEKLKLVADNLDNLASKVDRGGKNSGAERIILSGVGVETESGKRVREAVVLGAGMITGALERGEKEGE